VIEVIESFARPENFSWVGQSLVERGWIRDSETGGFRKDGVYLDSPEGSERDPIANAALKICALCKSAADAMESATPETVRAIENAFVAGISLGALDQDNLRNTFVGRPGKLVQWSRIFPEIDRAWEKCAKAAKPPHPTNLWSCYDGPGKIKNGIQNEIAAKTWRSWLREWSRDRGHKIAR